MTTATETGRQAPEIARAARLFEDLRAATLDPPGVTRATYGTGEDIAHGLVGDWARQLDLETTTDFAGNLYMTLPGRDRDAPRIMIGSHLDSVPHGGNFDGAAALAALLGPLKDRLAGRRVGLLVSGSNIDMKTYGDLVGQDLP